MHLTDSIWAEREVEVAAVGHTGTQRGAAVWPVDADVISIMSDWDKVDKAVTLPSMNKSRHEGADMEREDKEEKVAQLSS